MTVAEDARVLVARTATGQGLPEQVVDPSTLGRVSAIISAGATAAASPPKAAA